jgi:hypothetical protein
MNPNPLDYGLDEYRQMTQTPYERKREKTIKANFSNPTGPSGGKKWNKGWRVYNVKYDYKQIRDHISVDPDNGNIFHATVGHQHYGIDEYGYLWNRTDKYWKFNQHDHYDAIALYKYWRDM